MALQLAHWSGLLEVSQMKPFASLFFLPLLLLSVAFGQTTTGTIVGSVSDPSGLAIAGATVTLIESATTVQRKTETLATGDFAFNTVQPGVFQIKVEAAGFKTFERTSINLIANDRLSVGTI